MMGRKFVESCLMCQRSRPCSEAS